MTEPYSAVVCGLGTIGCELDFSPAPDASLRTHAGAIAANPRMRLIAGCDPEPARRERFARHFHTPTYASLQEALALHAPDLVSICSPTGHHHTQVMACIEASLPMVWLEKPPAASRAQLEDLVLAQQERATRTTILVNYHRRYAESYQRLREFCSSGELGSLVRLDAVYSRGLVPNGSHMVDLAFFLAGDPPGAELTARAAGGDAENPSFLLRFSTGLEASFIGIPGLPYHCIDMTATFERGRASVFHGGMTVRLEHCVEHELFKGFHRLREVPLGGWTGGFQRAFENALKDLLQSHEHGRPPLSTLRTALPTQIVLDQALE